MSTTMTITISMTITSSMTTTDPPVHSVSGVRRQS